MKRKLNLFFKNISLLLLISFFQSYTSKKDIKTINSSLKEHNFSNTNLFKLTDLDIIKKWTALILELDQYATGMRPSATARSLAYINLAAYETALFKMSNYTSNNSRLKGLNIRHNFTKGKNLNLLVALNACYADVTNHFIYNLPVKLRNRYKGLRDRLEITLKAKISSQIFFDSKQWGKLVAQRVIKYSQTDLAAEKQILNPKPTSYNPPKGLGIWSFRVEAERGLFPYWRNTRTFVISPTQTTSIPPPHVYSTNTKSPFYKQMQEVYNTAIECKKKENENFWIAEFWSDDVEGTMLSPVGRQMSIALQLIDHLNLSSTQSLEMFLKLGFSLNDAAVSAWDDKYTYLAMRPYLYIYKIIDPTFQTNLFKFISWPNPSFPRYPSGHSTFASAASGVFIDLFGDAICFKDITHKGRKEFKSLPRKFNSFSTMAHEIAFSRIPLGVHLRMDCVEGLRLGYEISTAVNKMKLKNN